LVAAGEEDAAASSKHLANRASRRLAAFIDVELDQIGHAKRRRTLPCTLSK
jgi:hypothetical protein